MDPKVRKTKCWSSMLVGSSLLCSIKTRQLVSQPTMTYQRVSATSLAFSPLLHPGPDPPENTQACRIINCTKHSWNIDFDSGVPIFHLPYHSISAHLSASLSSESSPCICTTNPMRGRGLPVLFFFPPTFPYVRPGLFARYFNIAWTPLKETTSTG